MGFIRFDNGSCLQIEFSWASNIQREKRFVELRGTKAGCYWVDGNQVTVCCQKENGELYDINPEINDVNGHERNLRHFVDVVLNGTKPDFEPIQGVNTVSYTHLFPERFSKIASFSGALDICSRKDLPEEYKTIFGNNPLQTCLLYTS